MLFRKKIEPRCMYCSHSRPLDELYVSCPKCGVVSGGYSCRKFTYDPLKRIPPRPVTARPAHALPNLSLEDDASDLSD